MSMISLAWRLLRGGGRHGMLGSILTLAAVTLTSALLLFTVSANLAFADRGDRTSWRVPAEVAEADATALEAASADYLDGHEFTRVDLASTGNGTAPIPPGMDHFPAEGEVWVSPQLNALLEKQPDEVRDSRFPAAPSGQLAADALTHDSELVAVVGRGLDEPAMTQPRGPNDIEATPIADFTGNGPSDIYAFYQALAVVATVLMVVPLLVFGGAAARLTVARRDERLASLRLVGATPGQVAGVTVAEAMITAFVGAIVGSGLYLAAIPLIARIPIDGNGWYWSDLWPGVGWIAAVIALVPILVGLSAVVGLRRVVISPLGVVKRHTTPGMRAIRLLVLVGFVVAFLAVAGGMFGDLGGLGAAILVLLLAGAFGSVHLVGPWVVWLLGRLTAALARRPSTLLAGRRLTDDPKSAWRTVAGVALTGFVAGFVSLIAPNMIATGSADNVIVTQVAESEADEVITAIKQASPTAATVESVQEWGFGTVELTVSTSANATEMEVMRSELSTQWSHLTFPTQSDMNAQNDATLQDIRTGVLVVLSVSLLIAMVSAAISGASAVLDRRRGYATQHLSGTPIGVLDVARYKETLLPVVVMGGGSIAVGALLSTPFISSGGVTTTGPWGLIITIAVGLLGILAACAMSHPLLRRVMEDASPRPD